MIVIALIRSITSTVSSQRWESGEMVAVYPDGFADWGAEEFRHHSAVRIDLTQGQIDRLNAFYQPGSQGKGRGRGGVRSTARKKMNRLSVGDFYTPEQQTTARDPMDASPVLIDATSLTTIEVESRITSGDDPRGPNDIPE